MMTLRIHSRITTPEMVCARQSLSTGVATIAVPIKAVRVCNNRMPIHRRLEPNLIKADCDTTVTDSPIFASCVWVLG